MPHTLRGPFNLGAAPTFDSPTWLTSLDEAAFRATNDVFNVKDSAYGAIGNGVADDSAAITAAKAAASAAGGGTVFVPPGTYVCEGVDLATRVALVFAPGAVLKHKSASTTYCVRIPSTATDAMIVGGEVDGNSPNQTTDVTPVQVAGERNRISGLGVYDAKFAAILVLANARHITVDHCHVFKKNALTATGQHGISILSTDGTDAPEHILFADNHVEDTTNAGLAIFSVVRYVVIANNVTENTGGDGFAGYNRANSHVLVQGNSFVNAANHGTHVGGNNLAVVGNDIRSPTFDGIQVASDPNEDPTASENAVVTGNLITGTGSDFIQIQRFTGVTVSGNTGDNATASGINILDCKDGTVTGNSIRTAAGHGIRLAGCLQFALSGNLATDAAADSGVVILQHTRADLTVIQSSDIALAGNTIFANAAYGVRSANSSNRVCVVGNVIRSNPTANISLVGANNVNANNLTA